MERLALYTRQPPPVDPIPILMTSVEVPDTSTEAEEIVAAGRCLRRGIRGDVRNTGIPPKGLSGGRT